METSQTITAAELERIVKLQKWILKAMAKKITWLEGPRSWAFAIGPCDGCLSSIRSSAMTGLLDQQRLKRSLLRVPMEDAERVLVLHHETFFDRSVTHFHKSWAKNTETSSAGGGSSRRSKTPHLLATITRPLQESTSTCDEKYDQRKIQLTLKLYR